MAKFVCAVCGYVYEGESLPEDFVCPVCGIGAEFFSEMKSAEREETVFIEVDDDNPSIARDPEKCVYCGNCKSVCRFKQGVYGYYDLQKIKCKSVCIDCGQCTLNCPKLALNYKKDYEKLQKIIDSKQKTIIFQTSPSVRVSLAEAFGGNAGDICTGKLVAMLRALGADYVLDTTFGADMTVMEEANELIQRLKTGKNLPIMTSCCPAWVKFVEIFYPEMIGHLSSARSPISMQASLIKTYFAKKIGKNPQDIVSVAVTPCTAKKAEIKKFGDADFVIPVRELADWFKERGLNYQDLAESNYDSFMQTGSGAGVIFGTSGGVTEAVLRTAYFLMTGKDLKALEIKPVRNLDGFVEAEIELAGKKLSLVSVSGTINARKMFDEIKSGKKYDIVEVMACLGGCMAGGGQPINAKLSHEQTRKQRSEALYKLDEGSAVRYSYKNPDVIAVYKTFLKGFGSPLLHTTYQDRSEILGEKF